MAYSEIEQLTIDLDLYLNDKSKTIHIASGGGRIPDRLAEFDSPIEEFKEIMKTMEEQYDIVINPNLQNLLNLETTEALESYLSDFKKKAKQGLYSYDKTKLGANDDFTFHLVAKPKNKLRLSNSSNLLMTNIELPEDFQTFNLKDYIE